MSRYIDVEAYLNWFKGDIGQSDPFKVHMAHVNGLLSFPTADVRPNVRGEWIKDRFDIPKCSNCSTDALEDWQGGYYETDFCPWCGADMRGSYA